MDLAKAIAAVTNMPHIFTKLRTDLGPRVKVTVLKQDNTCVQLKVHDRLDERMPCDVLLRVADGVLSLVSDVKGQVEMALLAEHLREHCPGAGPVITDVSQKCEGMFCVGFRLLEVAAPARKEPTQPATPAALAAAEPEAKKGKGGN
jgi:hypothetical protein